MPRKNTQHKISAQQEVFINAIIQGKSQRNAMIEAYPNRAKWKGNAIDSAASRLFNSSKIQARYEEILEKVRKKEEQKTTWSREQSIETLQFVIDKNRQDVENYEAVLQEELNLLAEQIAKNPKRAVALTKELLQKRKSKRITATANIGIISAVSELNKMQGYNEENINVNTPVRFVGEENIQD